MWTLVTQGSWCGCERNLYAHLLVQSSYFSRRFYLDLTRLVVVSFKDLLILDFGLDPLLLEPSLIWDSPPYRAFVFASHVKIHASTTRGVVLIALLPAQATSEAA
jgi:hypothetical protein